MLNEKDVILYFVRKNIRNLPREWRHRLQGVTVDVIQNGLMYGRQGRRISGYWHRKNKHIVYYAPKSFPFGYTDIYEELRGIEGLVRHELYHATGVTREEWAKWIDSQEKK